MTRPDPPSCPPTGAPPAPDIRRDDLHDPRVLALLQFHLDEMHRFSPADKVHAMPASHLRAPGVDFFTVWLGGELAGCGAIRAIEAQHGEIKSMRVAPRFLRQGIGEVILVHLLDEARARGFSRVSLETGSTAPFAPAHRLYEKHGFTVCPPFAAYVRDEFSICMTREL